MYSNFTTEELLTEADLRAARGPLTAELVEELLQRFEDVMNELEWMREVDSLRGISE